MYKDTKSNKQKPLIGITTGDINGIGPEVIIKALDNEKITKHFTPVIYGSSKLLSFYRKHLNKTNFNFSPITDLSNVFHGKINVMNCWDEMIEIVPGQNNETGGKYAFKSLEAATKDVIEGKIDALVTAPINKLNIQNDDFKFVGHTEYLTERAKSEESLMFLIADSMRVGVVTGHLPLKDVAAAITKENIAKKIKLMSKSLKRDFGIIKPKIAVLGLNPHAGEDGLLGKEEDEIIRPAIEDFKSKGQIVLGPFPADGFFGSGQHSKFDGVLAMYHDQGLIPFKSLTFAKGVNFTAGLPIVRTSPDHGTAYSIAGKDEADASSMRTAIYAAMDIAIHRKEMEVSN